MAVYDDGVDAEGGCITWFSQGQDELFLEVTAEAVPEVKIVFGSEEEVAVTVSSTEVLPFVFLLFILLKKNGR